MNSATHRPAWTLGSNTGKDQLLGAVILCAGIPFILLTYSKLGTAPNVTAAFGLGVLLCAVGLLTLLLKEDISVLVDPSSRKLTVRKTSRFGQKTTVIPFEQVASVNVHCPGGKGPRNYFLKLRLKNGKVERTGKWSYDQREMVALAGRLAAEIECPVSTGLLVQPVNAIRVVVSAAGAVLIYVFWYRIKVGPWCPAMWGGTAPFVIILVAFLILLGILSLLPLGEENKPS